MITKAFEEPFKLKQLEALIRRLNPDHPKMQTIINQYQQLQAQTSGEKEIYYQLQFLPKRKYYILHDVRLEDTTGIFQSDMLLLHRRFIAMLEIINIEGNVYFNEFDQLVEVAPDGSEAAFRDNPVSKLTRQSLQMQNWLFQHDFPQVPVVPLVVFSSPTTLIKNFSQNLELYKHVISGANILIKMYGLDEEFEVNALAEGQLERLARTLYEAHVSDERDLLKGFGIQKAELQKGVFCPDCPESQMNYKLAKWICPECGIESKEAYISALNDYFLLIGDTITNKEARDFLDIPSKDTMSRLLKRSGFPTEGSTAGRKYFLEYRELEQKEREFVIL